MFLRGCFSIAEKAWQSFLGFPAEAGSRQCKIGSGRGLVVPTELLPSMSYKVLKFP